MWLWRLPPYMPGASRLTSVYMPRIGSDSLRRRVAPTAPQEPATPIEPVLEPETTTEPAPETEPASVTELDPILAEAVDSQPRVTLATEENPLPQPVEVSPPTAGRRLVLIGGALLAVVITVVGGVYAVGRRAGGVPAPAAAPVAAPRTPTILR